MKNKTLALLTITLLSISFAGCGAGTTVSTTSSEVVEDNTDSTEENDEISENVNDNTENNQDSISEEDSEMVEDSEEAMTDENGADENDEVEASDVEIILDPVVTIGGQIVEIGEDIAIKADSLGEYQYEAAPSCLGAGEDKTYTFDSIIIYTRPEGERDNVFSIEADLGATLPSGIVIGTSTADDVKSVYGDSITDNGDYFEYKKDGIVIDFEIEDGVVIYAEIYRA